VVQVLFFLSGGTMTSSVTAILAPIHIQGPTVLRRQGQGSVPRFLIVLFPRGILSYMLAFLSLQEVVRLGRGLNTMK
jgi:hypothetical protein